MPQDFKSRILVDGKSNADKAFSKTAVAADKVVRSMGKVAKAAAAAGIAAGAAFTVSAVRSAAKFQTAITDLSAITGATGKDLEFLADKAREFGAASTFGASAAAEAFKLVASAKPDLLENAAALAETTRNVILLSEASGESLAASANTVGGALNQFGAEAKEAARFVNVLAAGSKLGSSEVADTSAALVKAGVAAASAGISFESTNAAIQTLATVSIKGAEAGTTLRGIFLRLQTQANDQFNPAVVGLSQALANLGDANLDATERLKLFGQENYVAGTKLIELRGEVDSLTTALTGTQIATEQALIKQQTFEAQSKLLANAFDDLKIEVGTGLLPVLTDLVTITRTVIGEFSTETERVDDLDDSFDTLDATVRTVVATFTVASTLVETVGKALGGLAAVIVKDVTGEWEQIDDVVAAAFEDIGKTAADGFARAGKTLTGETSKVVASALTNPILVEQAEKAGIDIAQAFADGLTEQQIEGAVAAKNAQLDALRQRIEALHEGTRTELEAEKARFAQVRETINAGRLNQLEDSAYFDELERRAKAEHAQKLAEITATGPNPDEDRLRQRIESIRSSTLTEVEAEKERYAKLQAVLKQGLALKLQDEAFFHELMERATAEHKARLNELVNGDEEREAERLRARLERIRITTQNEADAERERFAQIRDVIAEGRRLQLEDADYFRELEENAVREHLERLKKLNDKSSKKDRDFAELNAKGKTKFILGQLTSLTAGAAQGNKALFNINKAAAIGSAIMSTQEAVMKAWALGPIIGPPLAAVAAAAGAASVAAIASTRFGGGTTPSAATTPTVGGYPVGSPANTGPASLPAPDDAASGAAREVNILIQGIPESGVMPADAVRDLMTSINDELGDGANLRVSGGSGGGI